LFGRAGSFALSAERLTGVFHSDISIESTGTEDGDPVTLDVDRSVTGVSFLGGGGLDSGPAGLPRLGLDYFLMQSLSLGLNLTYATRSATDENRGTTVVGGMPVSFVQEVEAQESLFTVTPRVGYAHMFSNLLGVWGRGGLNYTRYTIDSRTQNLAPGTGISNDSETVVSAFGLALEADLVITPVDHVAIGIGPVFELSPFGSYDYEETTDVARLDGDASILAYGLTAGLVAWF
jgi:hypothetical protein